MLNDTSLSFYLKAIKSYKSTISSEEELNLIQKAQSGDLAARNALILYHLPYIIKIVYSYKRSKNCYVDAGDLIADGALGLISAINSFDTTSNYRLLTYAKLWILQSIQRSSFIDHKKTVSLIASDDETYWEKCKNIPSYKTPEELTMKKAMQADMKRVLNILPNADKYVLYSYFGMNKGAVKSLKNIGSAMNLTKDQTAWIKRSALSKLKVYAQKNKELDCWIN